MQPAHVDTPTEIRQLLEDRWRRASPADKAEQVDAMVKDCTTLAMAGIALEHP